MCFIVIILYLQFVSRQTGIIKLQIRVNSRINSQRQLEKVTNLKITLRAFGTFPVIKRLLFPHLSKLQYLYCRNSAKYCFHYQLYVEIPPLNSLKQPLCTTQVIPHCSLT